MEIFNYFNKIWEFINTTDNTLQAVEENLVDLVWTAEQPARTSNAIITLSTTITGKTIGEKVTEIRQEMTEKSADVLVITALDEVACEYYSF